MKKVLMVDDHPITRAGVKAILEDFEEFQIVGEAVDGDDAIRKTQELTPDVVIMDISMPNVTGIEATREILKKSPKVKIVALSIHSGGKFVNEMLDAGASGYILKEEAPEELLKALKDLSNNKMYLSSSVVRAALNIEKVEDNIRILQSKLQRPPVYSDLVIRTKIIKQLEDNAAKPFSLVSAGAGYGKSIIVSQWLEQTSSLNAWISLDQEHNNFRTFLSYLVAAIQNVIPGALPKTKEMVSSAALPPMKDTIYEILNELCDIEDNLILVLDDYQFIYEQSIHDFLNEWLHFPPPNVQLVIVTRRDPPLNINSLRNNGRMEEIRMEDLIFSAEEIIELFKLSVEYDLDTEAVDLLLEKTEGWIIGLKLLTMIVKDPSEIKKKLQNVGGDIHSISEYLLSEVLNNQPDYIKQLLLDSSVLNRFCEDMIEHVIENDSSYTNTQRTSLIRTLKRLNLFLIPLDTNDKWFRYHHLFQDFLQYQLKDEKSEEEISRIYEISSQWCESNELITEAIEYAIKAEKEEEAVRIIEANWEDAFDEDQWNMIENWLSYVSIDMIDSSPGLLLAKIWIAQRSHQLGLVPELIQKVKETGSELSDVQKGHLAFAECMLSYFMGDKKRALDTANDALNLLPGTHKCYRADAYSYWSMAMMMNGKGDEALIQAKRNLESVNLTGEPIQSTRYRMHPSFIAITSADLPELKLHNKEFFKIKGISPYMMGWGLYIKFAIEWWSYNQLQTIENEYEFLKYQYQSASSIVADAYIGMALSYQELGDSMKANKAIEEGIEYSKSLEDPAALATMLSGKARLDLHLGNIEEAKEWLKHSQAIPLNPTNFFWIEIPSITRSRIMIKLGTYEEIHSAINFLEESRIYTQSIYNTMRTIEILVLQSLAYKKLENDVEASNRLKSALDLSAQGEWIRPFVEEIDSFSRNLSELKEEGFQPDFIDRIFKSAENLKGQQIEKRLPSKKNSEKELLITITPREMKVLEYIAEGLRNREIADRLFNSEQTIKKHISNMLQKMNVKNRISLIIKAKEEGILE